MTKSNGKQLESLVSMVEQRLMPRGFNINVNKRLFNRKGVQIAELDILITGEEGSFSWLIECRDRPKSRRSEPVSWIEQLVGRRIRLGFNKVTAVSTTGFSDAAKDFAKKLQIELREVKDLAPEDFNWLDISYMSLVKNTASLDYVAFQFEEESNGRRNAALKIAIEASRNGIPFLQSSITGDVVTVQTVYLNVVNSNRLFEGLPINGPGKIIDEKASFSDAKDYLLIQTPMGEVRVRSILFVGELSASETTIPLVRTAAYGNIDENQPIIELAAFASHKVGNKTLSVQLQRMNHSKELYLVVETDTPR